MNGKGGNVTAPSRMGEQRLRAGVSSFHAAFQSMWEADGYVEYATGLRCVGPVPAHLNPQRGMAGSHVAVDRGGFGPVGSHTRARRLATRSLQQQRAVLYGGASGGVGAASGGGVGTAASSAGSGVAAARAGDVLHDGMRLAQALVFSSLAVPLDNASDDVVSPQRVPVLMAANLNPTTEFGAGPVVSSSGGGARRKPRRRSLLADNAEQAAFAAAGGGSTVSRAIIDSGAVEGSGTAAAGVTGESPRAGDEAGDGDRHDDGDTRVGGERRGVAVRDVSMDETGLGGADASMASTDANDSTHAAVRQWNFRRARSQLAIPGAASLLAAIVHKASNCVEAPPPPPTAVRTLQRLCVRA